MAEVVEVCFPGLGFLLETSRKPGKTVDVYLLPAKRPTAKNVQKSERNKWRGSHEGHHVNTGCLEFVNLLIICDSPATLFKLPSNSGRNDVHLIPISGFARLHQGANMLRPMCKDVQRWAKCMGMFRPISAWKQVETIPQDPSRARTGFPDT